MRSLCLLALMLVRSLYLPDTCLYRRKPCHSAVLGTSFWPFKGISICLTDSRLHLLPSASFCLICVLVAIILANTRLKSQTCCTKWLQMKSASLCSLVQKHCWAHELIGAVHSTSILYTQRLHHCAFSEKTAHKHIYCAKKNRPYIRLWLESLCLSRARL